MIRCTSPERSHIDHITAYLLPEALFLCHCIGSGSDRFVSIVDFIFICPDFILSHSREDS